MVKTFVHPIVQFREDILKMGLVSSDYSKIAKDLNIKTHHVLRVLRSNSLSNEILKEDIFFIAKYSNLLPRNTLAEVLGLTKPDIWKIQKKHELDNISSHSDLDLDKAISVFKFMIEEDLCIKNIHELPTILSTEFLKGGYYPLYKFCLGYLNKTNQSKPILGMLAELAYPNYLKSFQFSLPNKARHFEDVGQLNEALWWSFEKMTGINIDDVIHDEKAALMLLNEPKCGFSADNLRNNFISRREWSKFYKDFRQLKYGMSQYVGLSPSKRRRHTTNELRKELAKYTEIEAGCEFCGHNKNVEIHHIIPIAKTEHLFSATEINSYKNLILLCPNHHKDASRFDWNLALHDTGLSELKTKLLSYLEEIS